MTVTAQLADGRTLEFPDGTDPAVVQATVKKMVAPKVDEEQKAKFNEPMTWLEELAAKLPSSMGLAKTGARNILQGAADPVVGGAQLIANAVGQGDAANKFVSDKEKEYQDLRGKDAGFDILRTLGNVISPLSMATGGVGATATTAGRIGQGAAIGALSGGLNPVTEGKSFGGEKAEQVGLGAAMGGALPAAWEAAKPVGRVIRNLVDPSLPGGLERAAGRMGNVNAGDKRDEIIALLTKAKANVPNSPITAGEASVPANSAEFAAFQEMAKRANPSIYTGDKGLEGAQEAAKQAALDSFGLDKTALAAAVEKRSANAKANYGVAGKELVKKDAELAALMERPSMDKVMARAADLSKERDKAFIVGKDAAEQIIPGKIVGENGRPLSQTVIPAEQSKFPVDSLHNIKLAMDDLIKNPERFGIGASEASAIGDTRRKLIEWIGNKSDAYDVARTGFSAESKPINEMQVGQYLRDKLSTPLEAGQRPAAFAQATKDAPRTIKNAVGNSIYDELGQVLQPKNEAMVNAVLADLQNNAAYKELARSGATAAGKNVGVAMPEAPPTGMFNPKLSVMRALINRVVGKEHGRVLETAGEMMTTPEIMAKAMENAKPFERQMIVDLLMKQAAATAGQQP